MGDRRQPYNRQQRSSSGDSPERVPWRGAGPWAGAEQSPPRRSASPEGMDLDPTAQSPPRRDGSPQEMDLDPTPQFPPGGGSAGRYHIPSEAEIQTMVERIPQVPNPLAFLARTEPLNIQSNDYLSNGDQIHATSSSRRRRSPNRDPDELMQDNMRQAMHASRVDRALRAHAERLEAIGLPHPNARVFSGVFGSQPVLPGSRVPRRDTPAPWVQVEGLGPNEPPLQALSRNPAQPFHGRPAPQLAAGGAGDVLVSPEVAGILKELKEHLLDDEGHFIPTSLASAYRAGIVNDNDQIKPSFVGWLQLAGIPCTVKPDGTAYLGHEITAQPPYEAGSIPQVYQGPMRTEGGEQQEHPILQLQGLPALAAGISLSSAQLLPDMAAKLESLRNKLLYEGTDNFRPQGIADLLRFGVLDEVDQIAPQFLPWLKAAEIPIVFDADQKAYLGVRDGRSARTTGLGKEWAFWNKLAMDTRPGVELQTTFWAAEQLLRLPPQPENIDLGHLPRNVSRQVQSLRESLLDASGQLNPLMVAELHRLGIINEHRQILPEFVPWLRAAEIPLADDAQRRVILDGDAARARNYGRGNYRAADTPQVQERLRRLVDAAAEVQASPPPAPSDQRAAAVVSQGQQTQAVANPGLMNPVAAAAFQRILDQRNVWADPGQPAAARAGAMEGPARAGDNGAGEQEARLFGPDGERNQSPRSPDPHAREVERNDARQGIEADDDRLNRVTRSISWISLGRGEIGRVRPREEDFEPPPAQRQRITSPESGPAERVRHREQDFELPAARRPRIGSPEPAPGGGSARGCPKPAQGGGGARGSNRGSPEPAPDGGARGRARGSPDLTPDGGGARGSPESAQGGGGARGSPEPAPNGGGAGAIVEPVPDDFAENMAMLDESIREMELLEEAELLLGLAGGQQQQKEGGVGRARGGGRGGLHGQSYRNPLRKPIALYTPVPAANRMPIMSRKLLGDGIAGMICEMWPDDHFSIPKVLLNKLLNLIEEISETPYWIRYEHLGLPWDGPDGNRVLCEYHVQGEQVCECWNRRFGNMVKDKRGPNLFKRAVTAATCYFIRQYMPLVNGESQRCRWSREHNDLFYSWLHHYGEEHALGKQYNCVLPMERILEFQRGTGLDYPEIIQKLNDWAAAVSGWQNGSGYILLQEERMQYTALQGAFSLMGEWIEKHPELQHAADVPPHMIAAWTALARSAGQQHVDLDIVISDYIQRQRLITERNNFLTYIRREKEHFVLSSLEEINYEIVSDERYPREYLDMIFLTDVTIATNMSATEYFGDGREEDGLEESLMRPEGEENWNPEMPIEPDISTLFD